MAIPLFALLLIIIFNVFRDISFLLDLNQDQ